MTSTATTAATQQATALPTPPAVRQITVLIVPQDGDGVTQELLETTASAVPNLHSLLVVSPNPMPAELADSEADSETDTDHYQHNASTASPSQLTWQQHPGNYNRRLVDGFHLALQQNTDLVLAIPANWYPKPDHIQAMLNGYEIGSRVVTLALPPLSLTEKLHRLWLKFITGSRRNDPTTPIRLYDHEALQVLSQNLSTTPRPITQQLPRLENQSGFSVREIQI